MRVALCFFLLIGIHPIFSQENTNSEETPKIKIDSLYREDQFYFSFALNTLQNKPAGLTQDKFSAGFSAGFLRDFPINKNRTIAIAPGIGFAYNNFHQNLKIAGTNEVPLYSIIESDMDFDRNRFSQLLVEMPIELRWRTSTYASHKFWRVYAGFKVGYLLYDKSVYADSTSKIVVNNNKDFNKLQYGAYFSAGYNSINIFAYYGLNTLFQNAKTSTATIDMNALNVGIMFYIL
jgi:Outer membrane protein beta-barrel domain